MELSGLREALRKQPFQPFSIRLADGRSETVRHPEFVAVGPQVVIVVRDDNSWSSIDPFLIVSLEFGATDKGDNGTTKKRRKS